MIPVGIDIGRSAIKICAPGLRRLLPTGLARVEPGGPALPGRADHALRVAVADPRGATWALTDAPGAAFDLSEHKTGELTALTLLAAAGVAREALGAPILAVTGVPPALAREDARRLGEVVRTLLREGLEATVQDRTVRLTEADVRIAVYYEGDGIYQDFVSALGADAPRWVAVVDFGHVTTSVVEYVDGERLESRIVSIPAGGHDVYQALRRELALRFNLPIPDYAAVARLIRAVEEDAPPRAWGGPAPEEIHGLIAETAARVWQDRIRPELESALGRTRLIAEALVAAGGGARLFPVREALGPRAHIPDDPRFAQARGYAALAALLREDARP